MDGAACLLKALREISKTFIETFKLLPDLTGKVYKLLRTKKNGNPVSMWDDSPFHKGKDAALDGFVPRWMTKNQGARVSNRIRLAYTFTADPQKSYLGRWQGMVIIKQSKPNYAVLYPSPAPFEYPWMKENHHAIISERDYMIWKEGLEVDHFMPEGKTRGIGHEWADPHSTVTCAVCRTWNILNPPTLSGLPEPVLDPNQYNMGGLSWGYFACL
jgi:hypothetical protein